MALSLRGQVGLVRLRLSRAMGWLAGVALASPVALALLHIAFRPWARDLWLTIWKTSLLGGIGSSLALALGAALTAAIRPASEGALRVEAGEVVMETAGGARRIAFSRVQSGLVVPHARGARIELSLASGDSWFADVRSLAEGEQALRSLGLDAAKRRCAIPLAPRSTSVLRRVGLVMATIVMSFIGLGAATGGRPLTAFTAAVWLAATTAGVTLASWLTRQREITVGADGVLLQERVGTRFLRFDEIRSVKPLGRRIVFELEGDERAAVTLGRSGSAERAATIALRIEEAIRARSESGDSAAARAMLAREGRSFSDWRAAVARLAQRKQDYRSVALSSDDLAAILESPTSTEEQRIGAAMGLLELGGEEQRGKLRVAAGACAREPMRVALAKLADGEVDEAALQEALGEAERGAPAQKIL